MRVLLLNFEGGSVVPLLNFRGSRVALLNFEGVPRSWSHFYTMPYPSTLKTQGRDHLQKCWKFTPLTLDSNTKNERFNCIYHHVFLSLSPSLPKILLLVKCSINLHKKIISTGGREKI